MGTGLSLYKTETNIETKAQSDVCPITSQSLPETIEPRIKIHTGSNVIMSPFFEPDTSLGSSGLLTYDRSIKPTVDVLARIDNSMLGKSIRRIYHGITSTDHGFIVKGWVFLSPDEIKKYENNYKPRMLDIGLQYCGMGHIIMLSYIPETDRFMFRYDGGSNGWERSDNYKRYSSDQFMPSKFPVFIRDQSGIVSFRTEVQYDYHDVMCLIDPSWVSLS